MERPEKLQDGSRISFNLEPDAKKKGARKGLNKTLRKLIWFNFMVITKVELRYMV